jgi:hypothetical protein
MGRAARKKREAKKAERVQTLMRLSPNLLFFGLPTYPSSNSLTYALQLAL